MNEIALEVAAFSGTGFQRANNEDSFGYDLASGLFVVCDGMGGAAAGEVASRSAVEHLLNHYSGLSDHPLSLEAKLMRSILSANRAVWEMAKEQPSLYGMGTTLVSACVESDRVVIGNVGDSRAYFLRHGGCVQVTQDHSYAAEHARPREQIADPSRTLQGLTSQWITRSIGVGPEVQPDFFVADVEPGDCLLLTTDGLTRYARSEAIADVISTHSLPQRSLEEACSELYAIAKEGGAADNVTCLLLRFL